MHCFCGACWWSGVPDTLCGCVCECVLSITMPHVIGPSTRRWSHKRSSWRSWSRPWAMWDAARQVRDRARESTRPAAAPTKEISTSHRISYMYKSQVDRSFDMRNLPIRNGHSPLIPITNSCMPDAGPYVRVLRAPTRHRARLDATLCVPGALRQCRVWIMHGLMSHCWLAPADACAPR